MALTPQLARSRAPESASPAIPMAGDPLVGPDARTIRCLILSVVGFAVVAATLLDDWSWLAVAVFWTIGWQLERRTFVQCVGSEIVVQNRCTRHRIDRTRAIGVVPTRQPTGVRAALLLDDGTRVPIAAFTLLEPDVAAIDAMLDQLARDLGVPRIASVV